MGQHRKVSGAFLMILGGRIQTSLRSVIRTPGAHLGGRIQTSLSSVIRTPGAILGGRIQTSLRSVIRTPGARKTFDPSVAMRVARP
jgi:hypothetical protein